MDKSAPSSASTCAVAAPMPDDAPVTNATLSVRSRRLLIPISFEQRFYRFQKFFCGFNCLLNLFAGYMCGNTIITYSSEFEEPIQRLALFFIQLSGLDEPLMNRRNDATVLA